MVSTLAQRRPGPDAPADDLVRACLRDEPGACRRLYLQHVESVHRFLARMGLPPDAVEDQVQEVFIVAFRLLASFEGASSVSTWLYAIALHRARAVRRWRWRHRLVELVGLMPADGSVADAQDGQAEPEESIARRELAEDLRWVLERVPAKQREVVVLHDVEGLSVDEVAAITGRPVATVWSRLRLGRDQMRRLMRRRMTLRGEVA